MTLEDFVSIPFNPSRNLSKQKIEFIPSDEFQNASQHEFETAEIDVYADGGADVSFDDAELMVFAIDNLRLLSAEGEKFLFKRLNFLRFRANALQATLKSGKRNNKTEVEITRLLDDAAQTRNQIACANLRLIRSIARRTSTSQQEFEEFVGEANTVLLGAIDKFDYARGFRFSTYVTLAVQRHLCRVIKRKQKDREQTRSIQDLEKCVVDNTLSENSEKQLIAAVETIVESFDRVLDSREKYIVVERFGLSENSKGKSLKVIGDELCLSKERVRQLLQASLEKLAEVAKPLELNLD